MISSRELVGTGTAAVISDPTTGQQLNLRTTDGTTSMYVLDGIGNPVASLKNTGDVAYKVTYDAYGKEQVNAVGGSSAQWQQNPYGYKAGIRASNTDTGLTKFGYRWQSATTGTWIERDTLDAPLSPSNANRYAYAGADPINSADPSGREATWGGFYSGFSKYSPWLGLAYDGAKLGAAIDTGDSSTIASTSVGIGVGVLTGVACEGIVAGATVGVGAVAGAIGCSAVASLTSDAVQGFPDV